MRKRSRGTLLSAQTVLLALFTCWAATALGQNRVVVNADLGRDTISRHIYGHFSEHLGRRIYGGYVVGEGNAKIPNTRGSDGVLHCSLVNIDPGRSQEVVVELPKGSRSLVAGRILASSKVQDHNTFEAPEHVKPSQFTGADLNGTTLRVRMPPCSVVVLSLK